MRSSAPGKAVVLDYRTESPALVRDQTNALIASFLGWTLDAFDFFLVSFCATQIAQDFGKTHAQIIFANTITLAFRPVGAFLFGLLADRYGRRLPLMLDLVFYAVVEVATGFAPNYRSFLILRALFGIGMGGEWGVGASLVMEKVSPRWRGLLSGFLQQGYALGGLLAAVAYCFILPHYHWRALFFVGGVPALLALFVRFGVKESAVWESTRHADWRKLWRGIWSHWILLLEMILLMTVMMCASHGTQDLYPKFLENDWDMSPRVIAGVSIITFVGAIIGGVVFGLWSDRIGRRRAIIIAFACGIFIIPLWAQWPVGLAPRHSLALLLIGGFLIQFMVQGAWGVIPAHIAELSPDAERGFLPGFAYQMGAVFSGVVPWLGDKFAPKNQHGYGESLAISALAIFAVGIVVVAIGKEKKGIRFGASRIGVPAVPSAAPSS